MHISSAVNALSGSAAKSAAISLSIFAICLPIKIFSSRCLFDRVDCFFGKTTQAIENGLHSHQSNAASHCAITRILSQTNRRG